MEKSQKSQILTKKIRILSGKKKIMFEALQSQLGIVTAAAKQTGIDRRTHYKWLKADENYKFWIEQVPDLCLDFVENALFKNIKEGKTAEIIFYLKTKGKKRGYIEKSEIDIFDERKRIVVQKADDENNKLETKPETGTGPEGP